MTALKEIFDELLVKRRYLQDEVEEATEELTVINNQINELYAEIADLDVTIESIKRVLDDGTKPTFNI